VHGRRPFSHSCVVWQVLKARCHYEFRGKHTQLLVAKAVPPARSSSPSSSSALAPSIVSEKVALALCGYCV
jgi:hypothetical protein